MSEKSGLRNEVQQEREQLVAAVRTLRAEVAGMRKKLPFVAGGLGIALAAAKALRRR
jgi:hypothetical protein